MDFPSKRSHREQVKKERHSEQQLNIQGGGSCADLNQPKFGNLIPQTSHNTELRQFAVDVLGHYDDTMQTIQNNYGAQHMAKLYGVDRSQPITPVTSTAGHNMFDSSMRERLSNTTTIERRDPGIAGAEGSGSHRSHPTFGQRSGLKGMERQSPSGAHHGKHGSRGKGISHSKPNHPLMTGVSSDGKGSAHHSRPHPPSDHIVPSKHMKKHSKNRHEHRLNPAQPDSNHDSKLPSHSLVKSSSFTSSDSTVGGRTSPSLSEKGVTHSKVKMLKRSNSADSPVPSLPSQQVPQQAYQPTHTGETGHTSFSCYNVSSSAKKKKEKKTKKLKEKDVYDSSSYNSNTSTGAHSSQLTDDHVTKSFDHVTSNDSRNLSKPTKLNVSSLHSIEESTTDSVDLRSMLKEMHSEMEAMPSFLTPIHTPSIKDTPFFFSSSNQVNKLPLQSIKEESSLLKQATVASANSLSGSTCISTTGEAPLDDDIIGNVSSSDSSGSSDDSSSDSDDSSSEDEDNVTKMEVEENSTEAKARQMIPSRLNIIKEELKTPAEESTTFMLDQINQHYNQSFGNTLTPIKSSPMFPNLLPFPLNDESANLSPAKPIRSMVTTALPSHPTTTPFNQISLNESKIKIENSLGFQPITSESANTLNDNNNSISSGSDSSSSDEDSDSESSDSEDDTFDGHTHMVTTPQSVKYEPIVKQESKPFQIEYEDISQDVGKPTTYEDISNDQSSISNVSSKSSGLDKATKKRQRMAANSSTMVRKSPRLGSESSSLSSDISHETKDTPLLIQIPLSKVQPKAQKPQAKVVPYIITSNKKRTSSSTDSSVNEMPLPVREQQHTDLRYSSTRMEDHDGSYNSDRRHHHGDSGRGHKDRREWSNEYDDRPYHHPRGGGGDSERSDQNDHRRSDRRDRHLRSTSPLHHTGNHRHGYGSGSSSSSGRRDESRDRRQRSHGNSSEYYFERARSLKREADVITVNGTSKAIKYIQSIAFFMRHGFAQENESKWDGSTSVNNSAGLNKAYKIYIDTLKLLKYTMKLGTDCKPLIANCLRCHSVLLWKIYSLKQRSIAQSHKELLEVFSTSKLSQKSPNPNSSATSFSPLPSPASVGSTNSSCSGAGGGGGVGTLGGGTGTSSYGHLQEQNVPISKGICNKVTEYLTLTGYVHQGLDLWRQAEIMSEQYREIFNSSDRRVGRVNQFSPVTQIADWIDDSLQSISSKWLT